MDLTAELVELVDRLEPDPGPEPGTTDHTDVELAEMAHRILAQHDPKDFWVFAYGSLIWNPEFESVEHSRAVAHGWHRAFCLQITRWRGTRELPGLMMALDRGGSCAGVAYRLPPHDNHGHVLRLLEREIDAKPPTNIPRWIKVRTPGRDILALAFVAKQDGRAYAGKRSLPEVAANLASAAGHWGTMASYAFQTIARLEDHGIHDRNLWQLQKMVAAEIRAKTGVKG